MSSRQGRIISFYDRAGQGSVTKFGGGAGRASLVLDLRYFPKPCSVGCIMEAKPEDQSVKIPEN